MPALINNYTTTEISQPLLANNCFSSEIKLWSSSIIVGTVEQLGLNSRIHKLLSEFGTLKDNWDHDDAIAPNKIAVERAGYITTLLGRRGQSIFHAAPGPNGEIMLDIRNNKMGRSLELLLYPTRTVAVKFSETENPQQQNFEIEDLPIYLEWLNRK